MGLFARIFGGDERKKEPLLSVALVLSDRAVVSATQGAGMFVRTMREEGKTIVPGVPQAILREFVFLQLHMVDRIAASMLNARTADLFLRTLMPVALAMYLQGQDPEITDDDAMDEARQLLPEFDEQNARYARSPHPAVVADPPERGLVIQFALRVARIAGHQSDSQAVTIAMRTAVQMYKDLQAEEHLSKIVQLPA